MNKYDNSVVYIIKCKDENIKDCYIGSTTNFRNRKREHKSICNNPNSKGYNYKLYKFIREHGGFDNWDTEIIIQEKFKDKKHLHKIEGWFVKLYEPSLNSDIPGRTPKEYREANKKYYKQWREDNKEKIKIKNKEYDEENKKKMNEKNKQYYEDNKQKILQKKKEKINCECGSIVRKDNIACHNKSIKHIKYLKNLSIVI